MKKGVFFKLTACLLVYTNLVYTTIVLAEAPRQAGVVTTLQGEATLTHATAPDQALVLKFRDEVFYRDRIRTKAHSIVRVLLGGKAVVTVRALSDLIITEQPQQPTVVNLSSGKIALDLARSRMKPGEAVEVHTPNAIAAVRGTMLVVEVLYASGETATPAIDDRAINYEPLRTASTEPALPVQVPNVITNFYVLQGSIDVTSLARPGSPPVTLGAGLNLSVIGASLGQPRPNPPPSQLLTDLKSGPQHAGTPDETKKTVNEKQQQQVTALAEAIAPRKDADKTKEEKSKEDKAKEDKAKEERAKEEKTKEQPKEATKEEAKPKEEPKEQPKEVAKAGSTSSTTTTTPTVDPVLANASSGGALSTDTTTTTTATTPTSITSTSTSIQTITHGVILPTTNVIIPTTGTTITPTTSTPPTSLVLSGNFNLTSPSPALEITGMMVTSPSPLVQVSAGASGSVAGSLLAVQNSTLGTTASPLPALVDVAGTLTSTTRTASVSLDPTTVNTSGNLFQIAGGNLMLDGPLLSDSGGTFTVGGDLVNVTSGGSLSSSASSALIQFTYSTVNAAQGVALNAASATLAGPLIQATGTTSLTTSSNLVTVSSGSTLSLGGPLLSLPSGTPTVNVGGDVLNLSGGTVIGPSGASLINVAAGNLTVTGNVATLASGARLNLRGPLLTGTLSLTGDLVNVGVGATFDIQADTSISGPGNFINAGTVMKSVGTGTATISTPFTNSGMVDIQSGTLLFTGTVTNNGTFIAESGATLTVSSSLNNLSSGTLTGGTYNVLGTMRLPGNITTNAATIVLDGATSQLLNTSTGTDALFGFTTNASGGSFTVRNGASFLLDDVGEFTNRGAVTIGSGSTFTVTFANYQQESGTTRVDLGGILTVDFGNYVQTGGTTLLNGAITLLNGGYQISGGTLSATAPLATASDPFLNGSLYLQSGGTVTVAADALAIGAQTLTSSAAPVFSLTGGTLMLTGAASDLVSLTGGTLTLNGALMMLSMGTPTVTIGGDLLNLNGGTVTGPTDGTPLVNVAAGNLNVTGDLVNLAAATSTLNLTGPILKVSGGSVVTGTGLTLASGASLAPTDPVPNVAATVVVGTTPAGVALTPDGARAYVANGNFTTVSVINTATNAVIATVPVGTSPFGVALTPDGTRAYVANEGTNNVSVINTATNTVIATVPVGILPAGVAVTPDGARAYVANENSNTVSVINTATNTVVATVLVGTVPALVTVSPDGARAYVTNFNDNTVSVISTATNTVVGTVPVGAKPFGVAVTPDGARVYVTNFNDNTVSVINTATNTVVATVPMGAGANPALVAVTPDGTRAYVANEGTNNVSVINTATNTVIATVAVGILPVGVAFTPDGARAYVTNFFSNSISVIGGVTEPLFQVTGGTLSTTGNLISIPVMAKLILEHPLLNVINGGSVTANADVVNVSGTLSTGAAPTLDLRGRGSATASELVEGNTLTLGTDRPIHGSDTCPTCPLGSSLLTAAGATITTNQAVRLDTALLDTSAPLLNLTTNSVMTSNSDLINLISQVKMVGNIPSGALVKLNASMLTVSNGSLFNVAGGSFLNVTNGSLFKLDNTSTLNISNGALVTVSGGSVFSLTGGSLGLFGSGTNTLAFANPPACGSSCVPLLSTGFNILVTNGGQVTINPSLVAFTGLFGNNQITGLDATHALLVVDGSGSQIILGPLVTGVPDVLIVGSTVTPSNAFDFTIGDGGKVIVFAEESVKTFSGTTNRTVTSNVVEINNATVQQAGHDPFIHVLPGANATIAGPLLRVTGGSTVNAGFAVLEVENGATVIGTGTAPFIQVAGGTTLSSERVAFLSGSSTALTLAGPLLRVTGGSTVNAGFAVLEVENGATVIGTGTAPFTQVEGGGTLTTSGSGSNLFSVSSNGALTVHGDLLQNSGTGTVSFGGSLLNLPSGTPTVSIGGDLLNISGSSTVTASTDGTPLINVAVGSLSVTDKLVNLTDSSATLNLTGPILRVSGGSVTAGTGLSLVGSNSISVIDGVTSPLFQVTGGTLTTTGNLVSITGASATLTLAQPLLEVISPGSVAASADVVNVRGTLTAGNAPLIQLTGSATVSETVEGNTLTLGTNQPLHGPGTCPSCPLASSLVTADGAAVTTSQAVVLDTALLEATAPLIKLMNNTKMTSNSDLINLVRNAQMNVNLLPGDALIKLDASRLTVNNGSLFNVAGGSYLNVTGNLFSLNNSSMLTITNGALVGLSGGSVFKLTGSFGSFGTGANALNLPISLSGYTVNTSLGFGVALASGTSISQVSVSNFTPFTGLGGNNTVTTGGIVLKIADSASKVKLCTSGC